MSEAFIDLLYRGLPLGSRAKLSQLDAHHAYVELPAPMPVGTEISLQADGVLIAAHVVEIHEQTAGSERLPGMRVRPVLDGETKLAWWAQASGDPSLASRPLDVVAAPAAKPEASIAEPPEAKIDAKPEAKIDAKPEAKIEAKPEAEIDAKPEAKLDVKPEPELEARATDRMDIPSEPTVAAELAEEGSGAADLPGSPDLPASAGDSSPRGRNKKRRPNRR